jgi:hypothetical protein
MNREQVSQDVIILALDGELSAINKVLGYYENYIKTLSRNKVYDDNGNNYYDFHQTMYEELKNILIENIIKFEK